MSWGISLAATAENEFEAAVDKLEIPKTQYTTPEGEGGREHEREHAAEVLEQFAAAKKAVKALARSGAVGKGGLLSCSMSGHSVDRHALGGEAGQAEFISVGLTRHPVQS